MATAPYNGFEAGLATEGNPLQYPPGATRDELNFDLLRDGTRRKRLGLEIEEGGQLFFQGQGEPITTIASHLWDTQVDRKKFIVLQLNTFLYLWPAENDPITKESSILLSDFSSKLTANIGEPPSLDFASGNGYLIVVGDSVRPLYFVYKGMSEGTPIIDSGEIDIRIRDFVGVDDGLAVDTRPGSLTALHRYNLQNQGWEIESVTIDSGSGISAGEASTELEGQYARSTVGSKVYYIYQGDDPLLMFTRKVLGPFPPDVQWYDYYASEYANGAGYYNGAFVVPNPHYPIISSLSSYYEGD